MACVCVCRKCSEHKTTAGLHHNTRSELWLKATALYIIVLIYSRFVLNDLGARRWELCSYIHWIVHVNDFRVQPCTSPDLYCHLQERTKWIYFASWYWIPPPPPPLFLNRMCSAFCYEISENLLWPECFLPWQRWLVRKRLSITGLPVTQMCCSIKNYRKWFKSMFQSLKNWKLQLLVNRCDIRCMKHLTLLEEDTLLWVSLYHTAEAWIHFP